MSALASLERFGEKDPFSKNEDRAEILQSEWALVLKYHDSIKYTYCICWMANVYLF